MGGGGGGEGGDGTKKIFGRDHDDHFFILFKKKINSGFFSGNF